jgi:hypothetical protein
MVISMQVPVRIYGLLSRKTTSCLIQLQQNYVYLLLNYLMLKFSVLYRKA